MAPHQNGRLCAWTSVGLRSGSESVNVFLLLEDGMERVPVKSQGGQKLGGTLSGFGGTPAVLKDLDHLEQRPGKKDFFFATRQFTRTDVLLCSLAKLLNLRRIG